MPKQVEPPRFIRLPQVLEMHLKNLRQADEPWGFYLLGHQVFSSLRAR